MKMSRGNVSWETSLLFNSFPEKRLSTTIIASSALGVWGVNHEHYKARLCTDFLREKPGDFRSFRIKPADRGSLRGLQLV